MLDNRLLTIPDIQTHSKIELDIISFRCCENKDSFYIYSDRSIFELESNIIDNEDQKYRIDARTESICTCKAEYNFSNNISLENVIKEHKDLKEILPENFSLISKIEIRDKRKIACNIYNLEKNSNLVDLLYITNKQNMERILKKVSNKWIRLIESEDKAKQAISK